MSTIAPSASRHAAKPGQANIAVAWCMIALSLMGGAVLGLWSFYGPLTPPAGFEHYAATPRRLIRLAHIASVMLPVLNLLYVPLLGTTGLLLRTRILGCRLLLVGTVLLPLTLAAAAFWPPAEYALGLPVSTLIIAFWIPAYGHLRQWLRARGELRCESD